MMQHEEMDVTKYLKKVSTTIFITVAWLLVNMYFGIQKHYGFPEHGWGAGNFIFYIWLIVSLVLLILFYIRLWKK